MEDRWIRYEDGRIMPRFCYTEERFGKPRVECDLSDAEFTHFDYHKWTHMETLREECETFINDPERCFREGDAFPQLDRMSGEYYIYRSSAFSEFMSIEVRDVVHFFALKESDDDPDVPYVSLRFLFIIDPWATTIELRSVEVAEP